MAIERVGSREKRFYIPVDDRENVTLTVAIDVYIVISNIEIVLRY